VTSVLETLTGIDPASSLGQALAQRAEILGLTQASYQAVLTPREPGGLSHAERAALARRMARHNGDDTLAAHYLEELTRLGATDAMRAVADPAVTVGHGTRLDAVVRHADLLTLQPRAATKGDIEALNGAGVSEPDIVRLAELVAFVNYQARVLAGLRLLKAAA
jgi:CMD domain protein